MPLSWSSCADRTRERRKPSWPPTGIASTAWRFASRATRRTQRKAFGTWLYRITANTANQKLRGRRSKRNEVSWEDLGPSFDDKGQHVEVVVDWSRRLKDPAIEGELKAMLNGAIYELPADYRMAFLLRDVEGLSYPEIAETLQIKPGTVKSRVHRTRLLLRRGLAAYMDGSVGVAQKTESCSRVATV